MGYQDSTANVENSSTLKHNQEGKTMKKLLLLLAAISAMLVCGCSEQMNPVEPAQIGNADDTPALSRIVGAKTLLAAGESTMPLVSDIISVSQLVRASVGGNVRLQGAYVALSGDTISYDVSLMVPVGALPYDATITISIAKSSFATDGTITFGPCGLVFNTPVKLMLHARNIDFVKKNQTIAFYYLNNGVMEAMPASYGSVVKKSSSETIDASANIPHFSRYAFGR
jgi:hypothetical protein